MPGARSRQRGATAGEAVARLVSTGARRTWRGLDSVFGGPARSRVIVVLACLLALNSADTATVGASATQLRASLHISNTDIGLLVAVTAIVGAAASVPFGVLVDRVNRVRILVATVVLWGVAMLASAAVTSFGELLLIRIALGAVTASSGPAVASLVGDYFPSGERGKIYGYVLAGELLGAGVGFVVTGDVAALSWRAAFVILALPTVALVWALARLPEPVRGGASQLRPGARTFVGRRQARGNASAGPGGLPGGSAGSPPPSAGGVAAAGFGPASAEAGHDRPGGAENGPGGAETGGAETGGAENEPGDAENEPGGAGGTDAQREAARRGIDPDPRLVLRGDIGRMSLPATVRYVLAVRTNVVLIVSGACGYFFLSGVETFGLEFAKGQYGVSQVLANLLMLMVGGGAVAGVLVGGRLGDTLVRRRHLNGRLVVAATAALATVVLFIPAVLSHSTVTALPYIVVAGFMLTAQNPPIDAARLDIMPAALWGRAEGVRSLLRTTAQALAPLIFGALSDALGGGHRGLQITFGVMLVPLAASGVILLRALRTYPRDVATAAASGGNGGGGGAPVGVRVPSPPGGGAGGSAVVRPGPQVHDGSIRWHHPHDDR